MGRRLLTKTPRVDETGAILVNYAAGRTDGAQVGASATGATQVCVPFSGGSPLADRKYLVITNIAEPIRLGVDGFDPGDGYMLPGAGRGDFSLPPDTAKYSNRKQFLRGQYLSLPCFRAIAICARSTAIEFATSLELS